jgi:hypothetical protein
MLEEVENLSEKGLLQAMRQGSVRLAALSPEWFGEGGKVLTLAAENALWLPQDILSLLRGTRRWTAWGMRSLLQSLEKTNPNLAQKLSQAFAQVGSRVAEDGQTWRLSEDLLKVTSKTNSQTTSTPFEASAKTLLTPYVEASTANGETRFLQRVDVDGYIEVNPQTLAAEGPLLGVNTQGALRRLSLEDVAKKFQAKEQTVVSQLMAKSEPEDHIYRLGNKCYAKIGNQFVEMVPNRIVPMFWRIHDPMLFGHASVDRVMPSMVWDHEAQQWLEVEVPGLLGGGGDLPKNVEAVDIAGTSEGVVQKESVNAKLSDAAISRLADLNQEDRKKILALSMLSQRSYRLLKPYRDYLEFSEEIKITTFNSVHYFENVIAIIREKFTEVVESTAAKNNLIRRKKLLLELSYKIPEESYINPWLKAVREVRGGELIALDERVGHYESFQKYLSDPSKKVPDVSDRQLLQLVALGHDPNNIIKVVLKIKEDLSGDNENDIKWLVKFVLNEPTYFFKLSEAITTAKTLKPRGAALDLRQIFARAKYMEIFKKQIDEIKGIMRGVKDEDFFPPNLGLSNDFDGSELTDDMLFGKGGITLDERVRHYESLKNYFSDPNKKVPDIAGRTMLRLVVLGHDPDDVIKAVFKIRESLSGDTENSIKTLLKAALNEPAALFALSKYLAKIKVLMPSLKAIHLRKWAACPEYIEFFGEHVAEIEKAFPEAHDLDFLPKNSWGSGYNYSSDAPLSELKRKLEGALRGWKALFKHAPEIKRLLSDFSDPELVGLAFSYEGDEAVIAIGENLALIKEAWRDISKGTVIHLAQMWSGRHGSRLAIFAPRALALKKIMPGVEEPLMIELALYPDNPSVLDACLEYFPKTKEALRNVGYDQLANFAISRGYTNGYIPIMVVGENASKIKEIVPTLNDQYVLELGLRETNSNLMKLSERVPRLKDFNVSNPSYEEFSEDKYKAFAEFLFRDEGEPPAKKSRTE